MISKEERERLREVDERLRETSGEDWMPHGEAAAMALAPLLDAIDELEAACAATRTNHDGHQVWMRGICDAVGVPASWSWDAVEAASALRAQVQMLKDDRQSLYEERPRLFRAKLDAEEERDALRAKVADEVACTERYRKIANTQRTRADAMLRLLRQGHVARAVEDAFGASALADLEKDGG